MNSVHNILARRLKEAFRDYSTQHALLKKGKYVSYSELEEMSYAVCNAIGLVANTDDRFVAILGDKSPSTYAGICGTLFASRAYMPLNLKFPISRTIKMLELSNTRIIVAGGASQNALKDILTNIQFPVKVILDEDASSWEQAYPQHRFVNTQDVSGGPETIVCAQAEDTAYLLFTSGTTGNPKGVPVSNQNVCAYLDHVLSSWEFKAEDHFSHTFDLTFDLSVHDMMVCWLSGACLCLPSEDNPLKMGRYIKENDISIWFSVPSVAILMGKMRLLKENTFPGIRLSFFCGEPLTVNSAESWQGATAGGSLINLYGPSEATIAISEYAWDDVNSKAANSIVSIGKLFPEQEYVLLEPGSDQVNELKGELCLGGSQVIAEYLNDVELSKRYFVEISSHPGKKWYRTGDLVYRDEEEDLLFLGRIDAEVKISGFRVNLFEIDGLIRELSGVEMVASILDEKTTPRIISFVVQGSEMNEKEIIDHCRKELPWYMIPEVIIFVDEMPLNANGKIDRNELKNSLNG